ncbi:MAG: PaaI family thioesterase [Actinomycetia bacterium]|nr:PaaI family thioesterase [Actinomycetes bacterium]
MNYNLSAEQINKAFVDAYPAAAASGVSCEDIGHHTATARWTFDEAQLRPGRYISGPTMFMLADTALWFAVFSAIGITSMAVTSEMSIRFLRPAQDGDLLAKARVDSVSGKRIVGTIKLWIDGNPDRLVAVAQGSYARPQGQRD